MSLRRVRPITDRRWAAPARWPIALALALALAAGPLRADPPASAVLSRVVHRFDFDEPNYFGDVPRGWQRFPDRTAPDPAFPRYTAGRFDRAAGHNAAPSFYLQSDGRSIAFRYAGDETRVRPGDYVVSGWVKPDRLHHGRAALSAYYLDWEGHFIPDTQRFSALVASGEGADAWQELSVILAAAPPQAHFVGVTCWVVQDEVWAEPLDEYRRIRLRDVHGGAWFDDIVVKGRPRVLLTTRHPGNVVEAPEPVRVQVVVADDETDGLAAELLVTDRAGALVARQPVPVQTFENPQPTDITLPALRPDLYHATVVVRSLGEPLLERDLTFAVLGAHHRPVGRNARHVGVVMTEAPADGVADTVALLTQLGVGSVKIPVWPVDPAQPAFDTEPHALHDLLDRLIAVRTDVIGVLGGAPTALAGKGGAYASTLLDVLSQDPRVWRSALDAVFAPYASIFYSWQLGSDGDTSVSRDPRCPAALDALHDVMREMLPAPRLAAAVSAADVPADVLLPAQSLNVALPDDVHADYLTQTLAPFQALDYDHLWLTLNNPEPAPRAPDAPLADWALRLLAARQSGVDRIFTPAPWRRRTTGQETVTEPTAEFLVLRTLNDQLSDSDYLAEFAVGPTGRALAFGDGEYATVAVWDPQAPEDGQPAALQLGAAREAVDLWGRSTPLPRNADGLQELVLQRAPTFVGGVEQWLVSFRAAMELAPQRVSFAIEPQPFLLQLRNPRDAALSGEIELTMPAGWEIEPHRVRFALPARGSDDIPILIRQPQDVTAGPKTLSADVQLASNPKYRLEIPLVFELGLPDVEVWGYAVNERSNLRVRQGLTNRSAQPLSFRAFAMVPGRSRQYRTISAILPGQTLTIDYLFTNAAGASGRQVRLGLREVNGPRLHNLEIQIP